VSLPRPSGEVSLDDLELELRKLPGVRSAGFDERDGVLLVQLHVADAPPQAEQPVPVAASRLAARHSDRPVAVEVVRWRDTSPAPAVPPPEIEKVVEVIVERTVEVGGEGMRPRARLLAVLAFPDTDELEVHLVLGSRRTIGRASASAGLVGAVEATIDAMRALGAPMQPRVRWARALDDTVDEDRVVVAVAIDQTNGGAEMHYGLAAGASPIDAAARSTLDALNRRLSQLL
jgi:hypothetical protein